MKEFNIELARQGKPVCTRDGHEARIICFDRVTDLCPIVALVKINGTEQIFNYHKDGKYTMSGEELSLDLMMAAEKKTMWMNIYKVGDKGRTNAGMYWTKEKALNSASINDGSYITTVKVEWEE